MAELSIKVSGLSRIQQKFEEAPKRVLAGIEEAVAKSAFIIEAAGKTAITEGPTRAIDTGRLRADIIVRELTPVRAAIYPVVQYAIYVHEGTKHMRARPFMRVAKDAAAPQIVEVFSDMVKEVLK